MFLLNRGFHATLRFSLFKVRVFFNHALAEFRPDYVHAVIKIKERTQDKLKNCEICALIFTQVIAKRKTGDLGSSLLFHYILDIYKWTYRCKQEAVRYH